MADRPKRAIAKPSRYVTTSSEEEPKRRRMQESRVVDNLNDIDNDIAELRGIQIEDTDNSQINNNTDAPTPTFSQNMSTHIVHNSPQPFSISTNQTTPPLPCSMHENCHPAISSHYNVPAQSSTFTTYDNYPKTHETYYTNAKNSQVQISQYPTITEHTGRFREAAGNSRTTELDNFFRTLNQRLDHFEAEMKLEVKKLDGTLQNILKCVEVHRQRRGVPRKPDSFPIFNITLFNAFEAIDDDGFTEAVSYLEYVGGFNLKEAVNLCLKEALTDDVTALFTWYGRDGSKPLYNARIIIAIYEAVCRNRHFAKPARKDFQAQMQGALRAAKERCRSKASKARAEAPNRNQARDFWNDEAPDETAHCNDG